MAYAIATIGNILHRHRLAKYYHILYKIFKKMYLSTFFQESNIRDNFSDVAEKSPQPLYSFPYKNCINFKKYLRISVQ